MVKLTHDGSNSDKVNDILSVAQKRFGTYGFEKTTMNDIAGELEMSKAALYYYYPDKESLYKAVVEKEIEIFTYQLRERMSETDHPAELIKIYSETRIGFFRVLLNLTRIRIYEGSGISNLMAGLKNKFREMERAKMSGILLEGVQRGIFEIDDCDSIAGLFLDTLMGISLVYKKSNELIYFTEEDFVRLKKQVHQFVQVFIKGISKNQ